MRGEWWIDESGSAMFADGDLGEKGHEGYVIERLVRDILDVFEENVDDDPGLLSGWKSELVRGVRHIEGADYSGDDKGLWEAVARIVAPHFGNDLVHAREAVSIADDRGRDARDYALRHWGWIRVADNAVQMQRLDSNSLDHLASGLEDAAGEDDGDLPDDETFYLETMQPPRVYPVVPMADIRGRNLSAIYRLADRGYGFGGVGRRGAGGGGLLWVGAIALGAWLLLRRAS